MRVLTSISAGKIQTWIHTCCQFWLGNLITATDFSLFYCSFFSSSLLSPQSSTGRTRKTETATVRQVLTACVQETQLLNLVCLISTSAVLSIYPRGVYLCGRRHTSSLHGSEILNGSSLSAGANQSTGDLCPLRPSPDDDSSNWTFSLGMDKKILHDAIDL